MSYGFIILRMERLANLFERQSDETRKSINFANFNIVIENCGLHAQLWSLPSRYQTRQYSVQ